MTDTITERLKAIREILSMCIIMGGHGEAQHLLGHEDYKQLLKHLAACTQTISSAESDADAVAYIAAALLKAGKWDGKYVIVPKAKPTDTTCHEVIYDKCLDAFRNGKSIMIDGNWITEYAVSVAAVSRAVQAYLDNAKIGVKDV